MNFARQAEHLLTERIGNPETGLPLEVVQNGLHSGQQAGRLGLKQEAQNADGPKPKLARGLATAPLVQQDGVGMNLNRQGQRGRFSRIKPDGRTKQSGQGCGCLLAYAFGQSETDESRDTRRQASELDGHCRRDHNLPK